MKKLIILIFMTRMNEESMIFSVNDKVCYVAKKSGM